MKMNGMNRKIITSIFGCCLAVFWSGFLAFGFPGVMGTYWQELYDVGAAETGTVVTFMLLALAASMFFSGRIHMKIGMRRCLLIGLLMNAAAMIILMNGRSIYAVYAWGFVVNLGCSFTYGPALTTVQQWLPHRRGMASGLVNCVFGISSAIVVPVWSNLVEAAGYDKMNIILLILVTVTNAAAMIFAESPGKAKLTESEKAEMRRLMEIAAEKGASGSGGLSGDVRPKQALKTKAFWLIWLVWVFMGASGISMISLSKSYAITLGLSGVVILTAFNIVNGVGRIIAGSLSDKIGGEMTCAVAFFLTTIAYIMMPHMSGIAGAAVCAACVGFGFGTLFTVTGPIVTGIFGLKYFGMIYGLIFTAYGFISGILGPTLSGMVLDMTGNNYTIVFSYLAVFAFIGGVLILVLRKNNLQQHR